MLSLARVLHIIKLTVSTLKVPFDWVEIYSTPPLIAVSTPKVLTAKSKNRKWTTTVLTVMMSDTNCLTPMHSTDNPLKTGFSSKTVATKTGKMVDLDCC